MNLRRQSAEEPEVNLTSLIDVVLLLLVFFMVSSSFVRESEIQIRLPQTQSTAPPTEAPEPLEIAVTSQGTYLVNQMELANNRPETLRRALLDQAGDDRDRPLTIRADAQATHQAVVTAMDVAGRLGFVNMNIATVNDGDTGG